MARMTIFYPGLHEGSNHEGEHLGSMIWTYINDVDTLIIDQGKIMLP